MSTAQALKPGPFANVTRSSKKDPLQDLTRSSYGKPHKSIQEELSYKNLKRRASSRSSCKDLLGRISLGSTRDLLTRTSHGHGPLNNFDPAPAKGFSPRTAAQFNFPLHLQYITSPTPFTSPQSSTATSYLNHINHPHHLHQHRLHHLYHLLQLHLHH